MTRAAVLSTVRRQAGACRRSLSTAAAPAAPSAPAAAPVSSGSGWGSKFKIAAAVGVPLSIPAFLIGGIVYDPELRDDINKKYPEIVDAVRVHVGFEEDMSARTRELEQAFILSQPVDVTVTTRAGGMYTHTVSPLKRMSDLYEALPTAASERPIVDIDFADISDEEVKDPASTPPVPEPDETDLLMLQVPPTVRGAPKASMWDQESTSVVQVKKKGAPEAEAVQELEMLLSDIDESLERMNAELKTGVREVDTVLADIDALKARKRQVKGELRRKGRWWRIF